MSADYKTGAQNRNILPPVDQRAAHPQDAKHYLRNVKTVFFLSNFASFLQPLNHRIWSFNHSYRMYPGQKDNCSRTQHYQL